MTFGFNTLGISAGAFESADDEELKGTICHELGHILHYDYVYGVLLCSMQVMGSRCLYGIFRIVGVFFGLIGGLIVALVPSLLQLIDAVGELWWALYNFLQRFIYGLSEVADMNLNKYAEYRCDAYAVHYGCGEGLLSFLRNIT